MAAVPPAQGAAPPPNAGGPLAVPAPPTVTFANYFADASHDPLNGQYRDLFSHFFIDINNVNLSTPPQDLRDLVAATGAQRNPLALLIFHDGIARILLCPQRMERSLGAPASNLDGRTFAFDGDLYRNQGLNVEISNDYYNLTTNQVLAPTVAHIQTQLAADPALNMLGPYVAGDANTEAIRIRKITPIPFRYVSLFLARPVTPRYFFEAVYPLMVTDGIDGDCSSFIRYFQVAITRRAAGQDASSAVNVALAPVAPPRTIKLLDARDALVQHYFPQLNQGLAALQQNQIATQLAQISQQNQLHRLEDETRRIREKTKTIESFLGEQKRDKLLRMSLVADETHLAPFWHKVANVKKSEQLGVFQALIDEELAALGEDHLTFVADSALLASTTSLLWPLLSKDAIESGCGGNAFRFCDSDLEVAHHLNSQVELVLSGSAAPSLTDAAEALKMTVALPPPDGSNRYVRRWQVWCSIVLPPGHQFTQWLARHYRDFESFRGEFASYTTAEPIFTAAKGVLHLKYLSSEATEYWREQAKSPSAIPLPDPYQIRKDIQREKRWEPIMSTTFIMRHKILEFCGLHPNPPAHVDADAASFMSALTKATGHTGALTDLSSLLGGARVPKGGQNPGGGGGDGSRVNNTSFNTELFQEFRSRPVKSATIRKKIKSGDIPPLPLSTVDQQPMCLAWHTKGQCNAECPRQVDHIKLTATDYKPLHDCLAPTSTSQQHYLSKKRPAPTAAPTRERPQPTPSSVPAPQISDELGKYIARDVALLKRLGWARFISTRRRRSDFSSLDQVDHPSKHLLHSYKHRGVPVKFKTKRWTRRQIKKALHRGPHKSCLEHLTFLQEEFIDMIRKEQWVILPESVALDLPGLRVSPPGVVPQRDRRPRWICDYSWAGVNDDTLPLVALEAMQFGHALDRLLREIILADPALGPVYMIKVDLSDGFYRVNLNIDDIPKLGVVFPTLPGEENLIAFPLVLPMGWKNSPPAFCTATETVADLANQRLANPTASVPHPLDHAAEQAPSTEVLPASRSELPDKPSAVSLPAARDPSLPSSSKRAAYVDVFMDDFLALAQGKTNRRRVRRILLHAIDDVFRPIDADDNPARREPVSLKKLAKGDCSWATIKTLLGWLIDTVGLTIHLPEHRQERLAEILASIPSTQKRISVKKWHRVLGELRSMSLAIPGSRHLFSHMQHALSSQLSSRIALHKNVHHALQDFKWLLKDIANRPTRIAELVPLASSAEGHHDASGLGAGGVWFPAPHLCPREGYDQRPVVWRLEWPPDVIADLVTFKNPSGTISNSDLELAGGLLHLEALAQTFDIRERTVLSKTDNLATLYWQRKGSSTTDKVPAYLLRLFGIHQRYHRYVPRHDYLAGPSNPIADSAWLSSLDSDTASRFRRDFGAAQKAVQAGVSPSRAKSTSTVWRIWEEYAVALALDPFLQTVQDKVPVLQVFAQRVRSGELAAQGNPIRARSAEDYLRFVAQTFLGMGTDDPRHDSSGSIDFRLSRMISAWKKEDPPPNRVKPVPIQVIRRITFVAQHSLCQLSLAVADMIIIAFFFLLRPGEYTASPSDTTPFTLRDVQLFIGDRRLNLLTDPDALLLQARFASLTFTTQKNGVRGEVIGLGISGDPYLCPVRALARRVIHLRSHNAPATAPLSVAYTSPFQQARVTPSLITKALRDCVTFLGADLGFLPQDVSARCLRAAGANALLMAKIDPDIIRLIGRWRSDEMLRYLHVQSAGLMSDYARRMLNSGSYTLIPNQLVPQLVPMH